MAREAAAMAVVEEVARAAARAAAKVAVPTVAGRTRSSSRMGAN